MMKIKTGTLRALLPAVIIALAMVLTAVAVLAPTSDTEAATTTNVPYISEKGTVVSTDDLAVPPNVEIITSAADLAALSYTLTSGWYLISGSVTGATATTLNIVGDVHIILGDGSSLTLDGASNNAGISVLKAGNNILRIYAQSTGAAMGELTVTGDNQGAGIGSGNNVDYGTIIINGGKITAHGGSGGSNHGAGIGGGHNGNGGLIVINGGYIVADSLVGSGVGTGGGSQYATVIINGGTVDVTTGGLGIGTGDYYYYGGTVIGSPIPTPTNAPVYPVTAKFPAAFAFDNMVTYSVLKINGADYMVKQFDSATNTIIDVPFSFVGATIPAGATELKFSLPAGNATLSLVVFDVTTSISERYAGTGSITSLGPNVITMVLKTGYGDYSYLDEDGTPTFQTDVFELYDVSDFGWDGTYFTLDDTDVTSQGWFIVLDDIVLTDSLKPIGNVNLIIGAGFSLTTPSVVVPAGADINIWTEETDPTSGGDPYGKLSITGTAVSLFGDHTFTNTAYIKSSDTGISTGLAGVVSFTNGITGTVEGGTSSGMFVGLLTGSVINNKGTIIAPSDLGFQLAGTSNGTITINNSGTIQGLFTALYVNGGTNVTVNNSGTIKSIGTQGIVSTRNNTVINNTVSTAEIIGGTTGIWLSSNDCTIDNKGLIQGSSSGDFYGINVYYSSANILNDTTGIIYGGTGVFIGAFDGTSHTFVNNGLIEGAWAGNSTVRPAGIWIDGGTSIIITNAGVVTSAGNFGIFLPSGTGIEVINTATGIIDCTTNSDGEAIRISLSGHTTPALTGKVDNKGIIKGNAYGIYSVRSATVLNDGDGNEAGANPGLIKGWIGVFISNFQGGAGGDVFTNYGKIEGTGEFGVSLFTGMNILATNGIGPTSNVGQIICSGTGTGLDIYQGKIVNKGLIKSAGGTAIYSFGNDCTVENDGNGISIYGVIEGAMGIWIDPNYSGPNVITNYGRIEGTAGPGIIITGTEESTITNGILGPNTGRIISNGDGINALYGKVTFLNEGTVTGHVVLGNLANAVTFASNSSISGNFTMGTNAGATLSFVDAPLAGPPLKYSTVGGIANIGVATVSFKDIGGAYTGGTIVLIDAGAGSVTGTPANATHSTVAPDAARTFAILAQSKALIAVPIQTAVPYLDEYGDPQTHDALEIDQGFFGAAGSAGTLTELSGSLAGLWYYVVGDIVLSDLTTVGDVSIIIGKDCVLTAVDGVTVTANDPLGLYTEQFTPPGEARGELKATGATKHVITLNNSSLLNSATISTTDLNSYCVVIISATGSVINAGEIVGGNRGISSDSSATILNNADGIIKGANGIFITYIAGTDTFENYGLIEGTGGIAMYLNGGLVTNYAGGKIIASAAGAGIDFLGTGGILDNRGDIEGISHGVHAANSVKIDNAVGATIKGATGISIGNLAAADPLTNNGSIEGTGGYGIYVDAGSRYTITNNGSITARGGGDGIYAEGGNRITITNTGTINVRGGGNGIYVFSDNGTNVSNSGTVDVRGGDGIVVDSLNGTSVSNTGTVDVRGGNGIYVNPGNGTDVYNNGTVDVRGGYGIAIFGVNGTTVTNDASGSITVRGNDCINLSGSNGITVYNAGSIDSRGGNGMYIFGADRIGVTNDGDITATYTGIFMAHGGSVDNYGTIAGGDNGVYSVGNLWLTNDGDGVADGIIEGTNEWGIRAEDAVYINNIGGLITGDGGIYAAWLDQVNGFTITNTGTIEATGNDGIYVEDGDIIEITNDGLIDADASGIYVLNSAEVYIYNDTNGDVDCGYVAIWVFASEYTYVYSSGLIQGQYGIALTADDGIDVTNDGTITALQRGIGLNSEGSVINNGTVSATNSYCVVLHHGGTVYNYGNISSTNNIGVYLESGGELYNYDEISGSIGVQADTSAVFENWGLITGNVRLSNDANTVLFAVDSEIDGDFYIGTDPTTTLRFVGVLDPTLTYAVITGDSDIGNGTVTVSFDVVGAGLPPGLSPADKIILIDGSTGSIVTAPKNATFSGGGYNFRIFIENDQLIAQMIPVISTTHYITATAEGGSTISPSGIQAVAHGANITFTFSGTPGIPIVAVLVDGVYQSQAVIDSGSYTFYDVRANHTISVLTVDTRIGISVTVNVVEGKGHAEYSVNGAAFTKYTTTLLVSEGSNVVLRAVADDGYEFAEWRSGGSVQTTPDATFNDVRSNITVSLYFSTNDAGKVDNNLMLYLALILLILLVLAIILLLLRRRRKAERE